MSRASEPQKVTCYTESNKRSMNLIVCPSCHSPYFLNAKRYLEVSGVSIPENVYRKCLACEFAITLHQATLF